MDIYTYELIEFSVLRSTRPAFSASFLLKLLDHMPMDRSNKLSIVDHYAGMILPLTDICDRLTA